MVGGGSEDQGSTRVPHGPGFPALAEPRQTLAQRLWNLTSRQPITPVELAEPRARLASPGPGQGQIAPRGSLAPSEPVIASSGPNRHRTTAPAPHIARLPFGPRRPYLFLQLRRHLSKARNELCLVAWIGSLNLPGPRGPACVTRPRSEPARPIAPRHRSGLDCTGPGVNSAGFACESAVAHRRFCVGCRQETV